MDYFRVFFAAFFLLLPSCTTVPVEQARAFKAAVVAIQDAGNLILDEVGPAERKRWLVGNDQGPFEYDPKATYYYSSISEPPKTLRLRAALKLIGDYADLQLTLLEGKNIEASRSQALSIAGTIAQIAGAPAGVGPALNELSVVIDQLLAAQNAAEARDQAIRGGAPLRALISALRASAPQIFATLIYPLNMRGGLSSAKASEKALLYRRAVADFVVLLDRLDESFSKLQAAYSDPSNIVTLASLAQATGALSADVKAIRATLASLRAL